MPTFTTTLVSTGGNNVGISLTDEQLAALVRLTPEQLATADTRALVKHYLAVLEERAPGRSVEVRVPPYAAVQVVPGVTSAVSVPAAASVPVTQRGVTHAFTVVSGHLPPGHEKSLVDWGALARVGGTIVVVMGVRNVRAITAAVGRPI